MLVNCPECNSPVFVRAAAVEQRKPQRCYACKAQLLIYADGSVDVAVSAEGAAVPEVRAASAPRPTPAEPVAAPGAAAPRVNAIFGGSVISGEGGPVSHGPAPISFGDLDLGELKDDGHDLPSLEDEPVTTTESELDDGWPTMISSTPYPGALAGTPAGPSTEEAQRTARELLATATDEDSAPRVAAEPQPAEPHASDDAMSARDTDVELVGLHAATEEPSVPSGEASSEEAPPSIVVSDSLEGDATEVNAAPSQAAPQGASPDRRFSITDEDSDDDGDPADAHDPIEAPSFPGLAADLSSPFSAALGGPEIEEPSLFTAGTLIQDVPPELLRRSREDTDSEVDEFPLEPMELPLDNTVVQGVVTGKVKALPEELLELEPLEPMAHNDAVDQEPPDVVAGALIAGAGASHATGKTASLLPHDSSPYVHSAAPVRRTSALSWMLAVVVGAAVGAGVAWALRSPPAKPTPTEQVLLSAKQDLEGARFEQAINALETLLRDQPDHPLARRRLAIAYARAGRAEDAERAYLRYLEVADDAQDKAQVEALIGLH